MVDQSTLPRQITSDELIETMRTMCEYFKNANSGTSSSIRESQHPSQFGRAIAAPFVCVTIDATRGDDKIKPDPIADPDCKDVALIYNFPDIAGKQPCLVYYHGPTYQVFMLYRGDGEGIESEARKRLLNRLRSRLQICGKLGRPGKPNDFTFFMIYIRAKYQRLHEHLLVSWNDRCVYLCGVFAAFLNARTDITDFFIKEADKDCELDETGYRFSPLIVRKQVDSDQDKNPQFYIQCLYHCRFGLTLAESLEKTLIYLRQMTRKRRFTNVAPTQEDVDQSPSKRVNVTSICVFSTSRGEVDSVCEEDTQSASTSITANTTSSSSSAAAYKDSQDKPADVREAGAGQGLDINPLMNQSDRHILDDRFCDTTSRQCSPRLDSFAFPPSDNDIEANDEFKLLL